MSRHRFDHSVDPSDDTTKVSAPVRLRRIEVITGAERRRRWPAEIVAESLAEGAVVSDVARRSMTTVDALPPPLPDDIGAAAAELQPLHDHLLQQLKASAKLFCDETRCPVLDPGRGKTKTGFLWAIARDDRPWGGTDPPAVVYAYAPGRGGVCMP
jgi:hypothetical protein